jgi:phosphoglycerate dehydrogenase-like enzyme
MNRNVVVTYNAPTEQRYVLVEELDPLSSLHFLRDLSPDRRRGLLEDAEVLIAWNPTREIKPENFDALGRASFMQLLSAGADHVPFDRLPPQLIVAANTGAYAGPMAEHVVALALALAKNLVIKNRKLREGEFDQLTPSRMLSGLTAGIIGWGGIGRATGRLLRPFGLRIWAINTSGQSPEPPDFLGTPGDLEKVLRGSDLVVLSLPLTKKTRGMIGPRELGWMKPSATLINVARAALIDEKTLYEHARSHPDFLLGIDAWWTEPFLRGRFEMEFPFLDLPNVLGSPHDSAIVPGVLAEGARRAAANVKRYLAGEPVPGVVAREDYL